METEVKSPQAKTVLLTGITGFLARHIALQLLQKGYLVRGSLRSLAARNSDKASKTPEPRSRISASSRQT